MSTIQKITLHLILALPVFFASAVYGQQSELDVLIKFEKRVLKVSGNYKKPASATRTKLVIVDTYADASGLELRILKLKIFDSEGNELGHNRIATAIYTADKPFSRFEYEVDYGLPSPLIAAPHVSWVVQETALIKLFDILPNEPAETVRISFELPSGWTVSSNTKQLGTFEFFTSDYENAVFLCGSEIRTAEKTILGTAFSFSIVGSWQFEDSALPLMTEEILDEYKDIFGSFPGSNFKVNLIPFPGEIENNRWRAQTQDGTITIVSSPTNHRNLGPQRLHEQLRHELFHLWIPEGLDLTGDYGWFYEGFARYQSLKTAVWVGRITFDDYLRSMSEAINIAESDSSGLPLFELSKTNWLTGPGIVAAKGMSTAFYCDLALLSESKGKRSSADLIKSFYKNYRGTTGVEASTAIEAEFNQYSALNGVYTNFITGNSAKDWPKLVAPFAMTAARRHGRVVLSVEEKPKGRAKALLNKLGYTRWKKFTPNS